MRMAHVIHKHKLGTSVAELLMSFDFICLPLTTVGSNPTGGYQNISSEEAIQLACRRFSENQIG